MSKTLLLGTTNRKKVGELVDLLSPHAITVTTLADFPSVIDVVEDGESFAENAAKKATQQARHLGCWTLGEDSGLCVDALDGRPGIYSARFAGADASDEENNRLLLNELADTPLARRSAHYVCCAALADADGQIRATSRGICKGRIRFAPVGHNGFGYDPLFEIVEYHQTFGELGVSVKRVLSHRGRAMRAMLPQIVALVD